MRKLGAIIVFVCLAACSTGGVGTPVSTAEVSPVSTPISTQTSLPATDTPVPAPTIPPTAVPTAIGGGGGKIAFSSERDGSSEIYVVNADGSGLSPLANEITPKFRPAWSPDGSKIAFGTSDGADTASIYIMNADGSSPVKLIDTTEISVYDPANMDLRFLTGCCSLSWSPDGSKIILVIVHFSGCCSQYSNVYLINADGSNLIHITAYDGFSPPVWSPDSQKILFEGNCRELAICVMDADGTNLTKLAQKHKNRNPIWSPDGKKIAFSTGRGDNSEIHVMNADGSDLTSISYTISPWDENRIWSPDSQKISFLSYRDGNQEIYTVNADGSGLVNLTNSAEDEYEQIWSPDGTKIAFISSRDGSAGIFVMDSDGSHLTRLTNDNASYYGLAWSP